MTAPQAWPAPGFPSVPQAGASPATAQLAPQSPGPQGWAPGGYVPAAYAGPLPVGAPPRPLLPVVTRFGPLILPNGAQIFHPGINLAVPQGTQMLAPIDGIVQLLSDPWIGNVLVFQGQVQGLQIEVRYGHLSALLPGVTPGAQVGRGRPVALSGGAPNTPGAGMATSPQVHISVRLQGQLVDPLSVMDLSAFELTGG